MNTSGFVKNPVHKVFGPHNVRQSVDAHVVRLNAVPHKIETDELTL